MKNSMFSAGSMLSRPFQMVKAEPKKEPQEVAQDMFLESLQGTDLLLEAVSKLAATNLRQQAAAAVIQWLDGGDSDFDELDNILFGMAGGDENGEEELNDAQYETYETLCDLAAEFITQITDVEDSDVELMGDNEESADRVFTALEDSLGSIDTDEAISDFAVSESMMLESSQRVVRNGVVKFIKKRTRKRKMSAAQKAALKKAQRKSHSSAAMAHRKKSLKIRAKRGM